LNKAQVNLEYVNQQNALQTTWSPTEHDAAAALIASVMADPLRRWSAVPSENLIRAGLANAMG
jgi:hypothetical protein